jgi:crotonobetainyl-CoA:carnitine CoA-transferase CaiB-like acyl-CoA transferase
MCSVFHAPSEVRDGQCTTPLDGITVVSLEHAIAAPFCTRQLADLGARVIKVERPGVGDFARAYDTRVNGQASHFVWTNRSKESLTLDLKHAEAPRRSSKAADRTPTCWCKTWRLARRRAWACPTRR